jgi:hypothetical protein
MFLLPPCLEREATMKRSEIAAARVQLALARRRGTTVSDEIRLLAETPISSADPKRPTSTDEAAEGVSATVDSAEFAARNSRLRVSSQETQRDSAILHARVNAVSDAAERMPPAESLSIASMKK